MLSRRITNHVNDQNWFAVFIDFVIVVIGVFIGIQVANWNEARQEQALEQRYLERLLNDLNGSIEDFNRNVIWDVARLERQYIVLESLRSGELDPAEEDAFASGLAWAGVINPQRRRWGTVEELISTGNITLIRDVDLRNEIIAFGALYDRSDSIVVSATDKISELRSQLTPYYDIRAFSLSGRGSARVRYDFEELAANPGFIGAFADLQLHSTAISEFSRGSMAVLEDLRDELASKMGVETTDFPIVAETPDFHWLLTSEETER